MLRYAGLEKGPQIGAATLYSGAAKMIDDYFRGKQ